MSGYGREARQGSWWRAVLLAVTPKVASAVSLAAAAGAFPGATNASVGPVDASGVEPPAYLHTSAGVSVDQESAGRVLGGHQYMLTPQ